MQANAQGVKINHNKNNIRQTPLIKIMSTCSKIILGLWELLAIFGKGLFATLIVVCHRL